MAEPSTVMAEQLSCHLASVGYSRPLLLEGLSAQQLRNDWPNWKTRIKGEIGREAVLVDGGSNHGDSGALYQALSRWVERREEPGDSPNAMRLFDYLTMALDTGSHALDLAEREAIITDATVRLTEELVAQQGAILVVVDGAGLDGTEREILNTVLGHFLVDPLANIDPEPGGESKLGFVALGHWEGLSEFDPEVLHLGEYGRGEVRKFLGEERVVQRLLDTTDGDPRRLEELFDALPDTLAFLSERRLSQLSPRARSLVEILSVAGVALEISFLDRLVDGPVVAAVREICERGVGTRQMSDGTIKVDLQGRELRETLDGELPEKQKGEIHLLLAKTAVANGGHSDSFIASHALAGKDEELGLRYGLPAVRNLLTHGRWEEAGRLLEQLQNLETCGEAENHQIVELALQLAEARGHWEYALQLARQLEACDIDSIPKVAIKRRIADYLNRLGRSDEAEKRFQQALDELEASPDKKERARVLLGLGESAYRRGDHHSAVQWLGKARELICDDPEKGSSDASLRLQCDTLGGKVALFAGRLEEARQLFEKCATLARHRGDGAEESRAEANLGVVALQQGRFADASQRLGRALEGTELPGGVSRVRCHLNLGIVHQRRGEFVEALDFYRQALREAMRSGDHVAYGVASHNLATLYQDMGAFDAARKMVSHLRQRARENRGPNGFTLDWATVVEVQILLDEGEADRALEMWRQVESKLTHADQLYKLETRLRCVGAWLHTGAVDRARAILDATAEIPELTPQTRALLEYYEAALDCRQGVDPEDFDWYGIIDQLEAAGLYRTAVEARLELVQAMELDDECNFDAARLLVERGVENLRQRSQGLPPRFRESFFAIDSHRRLLEMHGRLSGVVIPEQADQARANKGAETNVSRDSSADEIDRSDPEYRRWRARYAPIVGEDPTILQIFRVIDRVAPSETTVLLSGESGTGKELIAEAIHGQSCRSDGPFIKVNCAAFVEELLLSELFGHEKGAFTGAVSDRIGHFERADGGTIFLDEIGDISPKTQVALLRVLQEGTFEPVGGTQTRQVDVRVLAATNRDLDRMVRQGEFRLDLYYRLKGFLIEVPSLRDRRQDIPALLNHFVDRHSQGMKPPRFDEEAVQFLARYRWPGNVRELKNFVRSVLLFADNGQIGMEEIGQFRQFFSQEDLDESLPPVEFRAEMAPILDEKVLPWADADTAEEALVEQVVGDELSLSELKKQLEMRCIERALRETGGNITQAARLLQMKRPRLSQIVNGTPELLSVKEELVG